MSSISTSKPNILRTETEIRGWLASTTRSYLRTVNDQVGAELRAEAIMLIWVLDRDLSWFEARDIFDEKASDLAANKPEGDEGDDES